ATSSSLSGNTGDGSLLRSTARYSARVCGRSYDDMSSHAELSAKLVEARNQRYLPLASHAAQLASAKPSVICFVSPVVTLYAKIARYIDGSRFAYASHWPSGDQTGLSERSGIMN